MADTKMTLVEAKLFCQSNGGKLLLPESDYEEQFVCFLFSNKDAFWLDATTSRRMGSRQMVLKLEKRLPRKSYWMPTVDTGSETLFNVVCERSIEDPAIRFGEAPFPAPGA